MAVTFWVTLVAGLGLVAAFGPLHYRSLVIEPCVRASLLVGGGDLAGDPDLPLFHDHRSQDDSGGIGRSNRVCRVPRGGEHPA